MDKREINKEIPVDSFERRVFADDVRILDESEGETKIVGYAAVFNKWSRNLGGFIEKIEPGFFDGLENDDETYALFNHNYDMPLAAIKNRSLTLTVDEIGLRYEFITPDTSIGRDLANNVRSGLVSESSFGFTVKESDWTDKANANGLWERTLIKGGKLYDVSPVTLAAYPDTSVAISEMRSIEKKIENKELNIIKKRAERANRLREAQFKMVKY